MCFKNILSYTKLCNRLYSYYKFFLNNQEHNLEILNDIISSINECGSVMIKFCQWITPKLELIYLDENEILNDKKPQWLMNLEKFYENCDNHSLEYTKSEYYNAFNENIDEKYEIKKIIGSGSIGQTYLMEDIKTKEQNIMKILHPNVKNQIEFFEKFMKFILFFPCIKKKFKKNTFDIFEFISQFKQQSDFITESNHLLYFYKEYENNDFIIIPRILRIHNSILIMSYEEGVRIDDSKLNEYEKNKIVNLYHLFVRNNQMIKNYSHGDLHNGNWKISINNENQNHKIIFYDFWILLEDS